MPPVLLDGPGGRLRCRGLAARARRVARQDPERRHAPSRFRMSAPSSGLAGAVLAGGESRRMGTDKAQLEVGGITLLARQLDVLRACGAAPLVVSSGKA